MPDYLFNSTAWIMTRIPDVATLAEATVELLRQGVSQSEEMRKRLAVAYGIDPLDSSWPRFVNNHAWALVRLQAADTIRKVSLGRYELTPDPNPHGSLIESLTPAIPDEADAPLPPWARDMVARAARKNMKRWEAAPFTIEHLRALWDACGGRCALTNRPFRETQVGTGRARKPFSPSLDRINPEQPYSQGNCRLVLQAVNFALNTWGDETFEEVTEAAVAHRRRTETQL